jgi:transitional endoplasmic reticulum ATPase
MTIHLRAVRSTESTRGLARLNPGSLRALSASPGSTIALAGARMTHARALPAEVAQDEILVDPLILSNAGVEDGARVSVSVSDLPTLVTVQLELKTTLTRSEADLHDALFDMVLTKGDAIRVPLPGGRSLEARVRDTSPGNAGRVGDQTVFAFEAESGPGNAYPEIGGMSEEVTRVHEMIAAPLLRPELFERLGIAPPRGVLFFGPPGSGKTLLARAIAQKTRAKFFQIMGPEIVSKHYGDSEASLRRVFAAATKSQPAVIFIDEIDAIAPRRDELAGDKQVERRIVAQLLTLMDGMSPRGRVVVMAATNLPDSIDPALRRPGRFDREIAFAPPKPRQRLEILEVHLRDAPLAADADLGAIARSAHGYVGADLAALAREAAMAAMARAVHAAGGEDKVALDALFIEQRDLEHGLEVTAPSALRGVGGPVSTVAMDAIGGLGEIKTRLRRAIEWPRSKAEVLARFRVTPARGILLAGPPGSGKTLLARALAGESGMNFVPVRPTDLLNKYFGEAEKGIARIFEIARQSAPTLLFFDEFDSLAPRRGTKDAVHDRIVAQLLVELDGIARREDVVILAATNRAAEIDPALIRPGRFDEVIEIPLPDAAERNSILQVHLRDRPMGVGLDMASVVARLDGASGADIADVVDAAAVRAAVRQVETGVEAFIAADDFEAELIAWRRRREVRGTDFITRSGGHS